MTDYKAHELNIYSNNNVGRLKFQDGKGTGLGPGFGTTQEYIFAKYTDDAKGIMQWPVCIPELHTIDNATGSVMGVAWYIMDTRSKVDDEKKDRADADSKLTSDLADEVANRGTAVSAVDGKLTVERTRALAAEGVIQANVDAEISDRKSEISRLDGRIDFITNNADGAAIDSLAEIVAQFNSNGATLASRIEYLEGVVASLVNKSQ